MGGPIQTIAESLVRSCSQNITQLHAEVWACNRHLELLFKTQQILHWIAKSLGYYCFLFFCTSTFLFRRILNLKEAENSDTLKTNVTSTYICQIFYHICALRLSLPPSSFFFSVHLFLPLPSLHIYTLFFIVYWEFILVY